MHLSAQSFTDFNIRVFDNNSTDASIAYAQKHNYEFELLQSSENMGFAAANNRAARDCDCEWLVFLNPDAYPEPDWLEAIDAATRKYPEVDAFGSMQISTADPAILDGAGDAYHVFGVPYRGHFGWPVERAPAEGYCFAPCAAAAAYRREAFCKLGGFEERFFCYGEDVDLGFRLRLMNGRAVQLRDAKVYHEGSAITGTRSEFTIYHGHRNRIWTYLRNMPLSLLLLTLPFHIVANIYLLFRFLLLGEAKPYVRGVKDAVLGLGPYLKERSSLHSARTASTANIARALTWSPWKVLRREADIDRIDQASTR